MYLVRDTCCKVYLMVGTGEIIVVQAAVREAQSSLNDVDMHAMTSCFSVDIARCDAQGNFCQRTVPPNRNQDAGCGERGGEGDGGNGRGAMQDAVMGYLLSVIKQR